MKVLLINAPPLKTFGITGQIYPPLGIMYLASYARQRITDLQIQTIDGYKENRHELVSRIIKFDPGILGIEVSFLSTTTTGDICGAYDLWTARQAWLTAKT